MTVRPHDLDAAQRAIVAESRARGAHVIASMREQRRRAAENRRTLKARFSHRSVPKAVRS